MQGELNLLPEDCKTSPLGHYATVPVPHATTHFNFLYLTEEKENIKMGIIPSTKKYKKTQSKARSGG